MDQVQQEHLMDIYISDERAFYYVPQFSLDVARDRVEQKKSSLVAGTVGSLFSRPKPEEIQVVSVESRLESFWLISVHAHTAYDRSCTYTIPVSGSEIKQVTLLGQDMPVFPNPKGGSSITLTGMEHCDEERRVSYTFDGFTGEKADFTKYLSFAKTEITDLEHFAPEGMLVVTPQAHATAVVRPVLVEVIKPVRAQVIHEERVDVEAIELNFRPVYALEYEWAAKGKKVVLEFDALTGEMRSGGKKLSDHIKSMLTRDLLFDVTADAAGILVPGGSIAVKLVKAVTDRGK
jgi:hypothetical protein